MQKPSGEAAGGTVLTPLRFISDEELNSICFTEDLAFTEDCGDTEFNIDDLFKLDEKSSENDIAMSNNGTSNSSSSTRKRKMKRKKVGRGTQSSASSSSGGTRSKRAATMLNLPQVGCGEQLKHCLRCRNKVPASKLKNRYCAPCTDRGVTCRDSFCQLRGDNLVRYGCCLMHCMNRCTYNILHPEHVFLDQHGAQQCVNEFNQGASDLYMVDKIKYEPMYYKFRHEMSEKFNYMCIEDLKIAADLRIRYSDSSTVVVRNRSLPAFRITQYVSGKEEKSNNTPFMQLKSVEKTFSDLISTMIISQSKVVETVDLVGLGFMRSRHVYNVYRNILPFAEEVKIVNNKPYMSEETGSTCYLYKPVKQREISCRYTTFDETGTVVAAHVLRFESNKAECAISIGVGGDITISLRGYTVPHDVYAFTVCDKTGKARIIV